VASEEIIFAAMLIPPIATFFLARHFAEKFGGQGFQWNLFEGACDSEGKPLGEGLLMLCSGVFIVSGSIYAFALQTSIGAAIVGLLVGLFVVVLGLCGMKGELSMLNKK
jgi:hypothetical protein